MLNLYVGQTKNTLMQRFQGHFGMIQRNDPKSDIAKHYNSANHKGTNDMQIHILDFIHLNPGSLPGGKIRNQIEMNWIHRLHTQQPMGLNILDDLRTDHTRHTRNWRFYQKRPETPTLNNSTTS